jgi:hypothetical protein
MDTDKLQDQVHQLDLEIARLDIELREHFKRLREQFGPPGGFVYGGVWCDRKNRL